MFLKNRAGMDTMQMVLLGIAIVALGLLFISKFQGGTKTAGNTVNSSVGTASNSLNTAASAISN